MGGDEREGPARVPTPHHIQYARLSNTRLIRTNLRVASHTGIFDSRLREYPTVTGISSASMSGG